MPDRAPPLAVLMLVLGALALGGCDDGKDNGNDVTPTDTAVATEQSSATFVSIPTDTPPRTVIGPDIRQEDPTQQSGLSDYLATSGGQVDPIAILYADLTGDSVEDAVVPVSSGGEGGNIAVFVYGYVDGQVQSLLEAVPETPPVNVAIRDGALVTEEGVYADGDPLCCPSQIRTTSYRWNGSELVVDTQETRDVP